MSRRHPFAAVNLISNPIHGYVELTKRLTPEQADLAGLAPESVAEEDLLDTAWLQRLRRISQLQSTRWVFPTAEHSRFTHGLGVMHEAGLWGRSLYPSLSGSLAALGAPRPSEGLVVETLRMAGQNCGLKGLSFVMFLLVPAAFPSILTGLKIGWAFAWRTLIAAELVFGASSRSGGLGWFIFENRNELETASVFAGLFTVILIGLFVESVIFRAIEKATIRRWGMQN